MNRVHMPKAAWRKLVMRILAIVLIVMMVSSFVLVYVVSALGESAVAPLEYDIAIEILEDREALHVTQRLVYSNNTGEVLDRVLFSVPANLFRSESTLFYEGETLENAFSAGYVPGGVEILSVSVDGAEANYAMTNGEQTLMRVSTELDPGEKCEFVFEYYVLTSRNGAFLGYGEEGWRLSGFYFAACPWSAEHGEFLQSTPTEGARWMREESADFCVSVELPDDMMLASSGEREEGALLARSVNGFALAFGNVWREYEGVSDAGTRVRVLTGDRRGDEALGEAIRALNFYEAQMGLPAMEEIEICETDIAEEEMCHPGLIWIQTGKMGDEHLIRRCIAEQFLGFTARFDPAEDGWIGRVASEYLAYLAYEEEEGPGALAGRLNEEVAPYMAYTLPGNLYMTNPPATMTAEEYEIAVVKRGVIVFHELRFAMGREELLSALAILCDMGREGGMLDDDDFSAALERASGKNWADFLSDWIYNIGEYSGYELDIYE